MVGPITRKVEKGRGNFQKSKNFEVGPKGEEGQGGEAGGKGIQGNPNINQFVSRGKGENNVDNALTFPQFVNRPKTRKILKEGSPNKGNNSKPVSKNPKQVEAEELNQSQTSNPKGKGEKKRPGTSGGEQLRLR